MTSRDALAPRDTNLDPFSVPGAVPRAHPPKGAGGAKVITYSRRRNKAMSAKNKERDDAAKLAEEVDLAGWEPSVSESRLAADEAIPRKRRKLLSKPIRDMERSIGKNAPPSDDAPRLRELWSIATGA